MVVRDPDLVSAPDLERPTNRQDAVELTSTGTGSATQLAAAARETAVAEEDDAQSSGNGDGQRIGTFINKRYQLTKLLGKGGMGLVYAARDHELDEEVAIKLLQPEYTTELSEIERLKREIVTARRITHPNVIRIHEFGMDEGGEAFISMEVLPGGSLEEEMRGGLLPLNRGVNIAIGICEGLGSAHDQGIVHRDIKPENVLFAADGRAKLVDFGLARSAGTTQHTVWGVTGTPRYMSPEQSLGGEATPRTDVYSMGVLLFQIFTGEFPFDGRNIEELARKHAEDPPPRPRSLRKEIPAKLEAIILQALEKDPQKRFRNANEIATELRALKDSNAGPVAGAVTPSRPSGDSTRLYRDAEVVPASAPDERSVARTVVGGWGPRADHSPPDASRRPTARTRPAASRRRSPGASRAVLAPARRRPSRDASRATGRAPTASGGNRATVGATPHPFHPGASRST